MSETAPDAEDTAKRTMASIAYSKLRQEIISGELRPGSKLKIGDLCRRFEIGLSPVREALSRLSAEGLVRQLDQRGFSVSPLDEAGLLDLTRARCWLNEIGLRQSIAHGDLAWEEEIVLCCHRLSRARRIVGEDPTTRTPEWATAHRAFHRALIAASGSDWLTGFCDQLFDAAERYRYLSRRANRTRENVDAEHEAIMEATLQRDADLAVARLTAHFNTTAEFSRVSIEALKG